MKLPKCLISLSVFVNEKTGGKQGWSLCARFYEGKLEGKRLHCIMAKVSDKLFWFDPQHCRKSYLERTRK